MGVTVVAVTGSVPPFSDRPHYTPPATPPQGPTPLWETNPEAAADHAKPVYTGPLGEFLVTPGQAAEHPPCPQPSKRKRNYRYSELYSPVFGENLEVVECAGGRIKGISFYGAAAIGRRYFVGPAKVPYEAPFERLVLLTVGGHSAIAQLPMPGDPGSLRLAVIERFPSGREPGIMTWIDNTDMSLQEAAAAVAKIMGVRP